MQQPQRHARIMPDERSPLAASQARLLAPHGLGRARLSAQVVNFRAAPCSVSCAVDTPRHLDDILITGPRH